MISVRRIGLIRIVVTIITISTVMTEINVFTLTEFRAAGNVHTLKREFRMPGYKECTWKLCASISDFTVLILLAIRHALLWALQLLWTGFFNLF
jgi:hypothetical protein